MSAESVFAAFITICIMLAIFDLLLSGMSFRHKTKTGFYLGFTCIFAAIANIGYLASILRVSYFLVSLASSVYFVSIDFMLLMALGCIANLTQHNIFRVENIIFRILFAYACFELLIFAINPFHEIAISYEWRDTVLSCYSYVKKPLYYLHLGFTYMMSAGLFTMLAVKIFSVPAEYRRQYHFIILGLSLIILVNALFLYRPTVSVYSIIDYSIPCYSLAAGFIYWSCFNYSTHGMLIQFKTGIFDSLDQGLLLFDCDENLILTNERAHQLLPMVKTGDRLSLDDFQTQSGIVINRDSNQNYSMQCYVPENGSNRPLRCDYRRLLGKNERQIGQLLVFTDAKLDTDILTGFHNLDSFERLSTDNPQNYSAVSSVVIFDINGLSTVNSGSGRSTGDQIVQELSEKMRSAFPQETYFVRGREANLFALCKNADISEVQKYAAETKQNFSGTVQYAVAGINPDGNGLHDAMENAAKALRAKKLMDRNSSHSELLTSLVRALKECDSDTEAHVKRTQELGAALGGRIGLSDIEQSNLALLCILHDIGKIGIPLDILNKPGKLSDAEWAILRTHAEKGYQIALSSQELAGIADMILHHHERWDGKGYPDGLSGETIPLLSRVISVVDAYDAMVNDRAYRPAMPKEKAFAELKRCSGTQFDPHIVNEFTQMLEERRPTETPEKSDKPKTASAQTETGRTRSSTSKMTALNTHDVKYCRYVLDSRNYIIEADAQFTALTGYSLVEIRQLKLTQDRLIPEEDLTEYLTLVNEQLAKNSLAYFEHRLIRNDGSIIYVLCSGRRYYDSAARAERSEILVVDWNETYTVRLLAEDERKRAQNQLEQWENNHLRDSQTGLLTHASFKAEVEAKLLQHEKQLIFLMMDVDNFKKYNDTYGHQAGDEFLILLAQAIMASVRSQDFACRMGGDEFAAALVFDAGSEKIMLERAKQIFDKICLTIRSVKGSPGISMGACISGERIHSFKELYAAADQALSTAKNHGKDRIEFWSESADNT